MNISTKFLKKFFNQPTCKCVYCDKKKVIVTVHVNCDFESVCNTTLESIQLCKNCLFKMAQNEMIMVSLYSLTRISVFKLLDKVDDLSIGGKQTLQEMQNILKTEREFLTQSLSDN
jgi:hypothetical protein